MGSLLHNEVPQYAPGKGLDISFSRLGSRFGHIAWTPPSLAHSVVLVGGSLKNAEVVPGGSSSFLKFNHF